MKWLATLVLVCLCLTTVLAQAPADVAKAAYNKLHDAKTLECTMEVTFPGAKPEEWKVQFLKPNLYSLIGDDQQYRFDGKSESQYWPLTRRYQLAAKTESSPPFASGISMFFGPQPPSVTGGAATKLDGKDAYRLDIAGGKQTWYIDPASSLPLGYDEQISDAVLKVRYSDISLDTPILAQSLAWAPPADAKPLGTPGRDSKLLPPGQAAPPLSFKGIDGTLIDLAKAFDSHRATLIFFWNGSPPSDDLAFLKETAAQEQAQRLAIIGIELKNSPDIDKSLQGLPFPVAIDSEGAISKAYGVDASTEYIIGPDGKVAAHFLGFDPGGIVKVLRQRGFRV